MDPRRAPQALAGSVDAALRAVRQQNPDRTRQDILNLLLQSPYLECKTTANPPPYGPQVVTIIGTITTYYRGNAYQTPLVIYVPSQFPAVPPTVQLNPTSDMTYDRRCPSINENGRVVHPCVNLDWRPQTSSLAECIAVLASAFGDGGVPPLRAADPGMVRPAPSPYGYGGQPGPAMQPAAGAAYPPNAMGAYGQPGSMQPAAYGYPPAAGGAMGYPPQGGVGPQATHMAAPHASAYGPRPTAGQQPGGQYTYTYPPAAGRGPEGAPGAASAGGWAGAAGGAAGGALGAGQPGRQAELHRQNSDAELKAELRAAVIARLQEQLKSRYESLAKAADDTAALGDDLATRQAQAGAALAALQDRHTTLTSYIAEVRSRTEAAKTWLAEYEASQANGRAGAGAGAGRPALMDAGDAASVSSGRSGGAQGTAMAARGGWAAGPAGSSGIGSASHSYGTSGGGRGMGMGLGYDAAMDTVMPTSILGRQLLSKVAEDVALEDYIPHIDEALANRRIRPEEAISEVRDVARRQFQARALAMKIDRALEAAARSTAELHRQYASPPAAAAGGYGGFQGGPAGQPFGQANYRDLVNRSGGLPTPATPTTQLGDGVMAMAIGGPGGAGGRAPIPAGGPRV